MKTHNIKDPHKRKEFITKSLSKDWIRREVLEMSVQFLQLMKRDLNKKVWYEMDYEFGIELTTAIKTLKEVLK